MSEPLTEGVRIARDMARSSRVCWFCDQSEHRIRPVAYLWTFQNGGVMPLCAQCCAAWRIENDAHPELTPPLRIETAPRAGGTRA